MIYHPEFSLKSRKNFILLRFILLRCEIQQNVTPGELSHFSFVVSASISHQGVQEMQHTRILYVHVPTHTHTRRSIKYCVDPFKKTFAFK